MNLGFKGMRICGSDVTCEPILTAKFWYINNGTIFEEDMFMSMDKLKRIEDMFLDCAKQLQDYRRKQK